MNCCAGARTALLQPSGIGLISAEIANCRNVAATTSLAGRELGERTKYETDCAYSRSDGRAGGLRHDAAAARDANLRRWIAGSGRPAMSAASTAPTASTAAPNGLPGWNHGACWHDLPDSAAAPADDSAAAGPRGRTWLSLGSRPATDVGDW
jgi:hypothetical protein